MPGAIELFKLLSPVAPVNKMTRKGPTIGHDFQVQVRLTDIRYCELEWWEKSDHPYDTHMRPNAWCNLFVLRPHSPVFENWLRERQNVPFGPTEFPLHDQPGIMCQDCPRRDLFFEIRVRTINREGPNRQRVIRAKETLISDPISHHFTIIENDRSTAVSTAPPGW